MTIKKILAGTLCAAALTMTSCKTEGEKHLIKIWPVVEFEGKYQCSTDFVDVLLAKDWKLIGKKNLYGDTHYYLNSNVKGEDIAKTIHLLDKCEEILYKKP